MMADTKKDKDAASRPSAPEMGAEHGRPRGPMKDGETAKVENPYEHVDPNAELHPRSPHDTWENPGGAVPVGDPPEGGAIIHPPQNNSSQAREVNVRDGSKPKKKDGDNEVVVSPIEQVMSVSREREFLADTSSEQPSDPWATDEEDDKPKRGRKPKKS